MATDPTARGVVLLDPELAQHAQVVRTANFVTESEAQLLKAAAARHKQQHRDEPGWYGGDRRRCLYLQHGGLPADLQPLLARINEHVQSIDREWWGVLPQLRDQGELDGGLEARCVELHEYNDETKRQCPNHVDTGSLFTADVMLNRPGVDFEGGEMLTTQSDYSTGTQTIVTRHQFEFGDCLVFLSHKAHSVAPVSSGERIVLVIEFWGRGQCVGNHRCDGRCGLASAKRTVTPAATCENKRRKKLIPFVRLGRCAKRI